MIRSRKVLVFLSAVVFCLSLLMAGPVTETNAQACYELAVSDDCETWAYTYVLLYSDYTFDEESGGYGDWGIFGSSLYLQFWDGCQELFAGTKKQGFFGCTDGTRQGQDYPPGCFALKKSRACNFPGKAAHDKQHSEPDASSDLP